MSYLALSASAKVGGEGGSFVSGSHIYLRKDFLGADLRRSSLDRSSGAWLKHLGQSTAVKRRRLSVSAKIKRGKKYEYPWPEDIDPNLESGHLSYLSNFKPLTEKPKTVTLAFEKPLVGFEKKIIDARKKADKTAPDYTDKISDLEQKYQKTFEGLYTQRTPIERLQIARHPNRPTFLDHVLNITEKWVELHGDRAGYDDPAIVTGIGSIDGKTYMFIGHQKGRNTKENIKRNFGMPTPHGYRKALRMMRYADHHGFPIITFIDTPGAFADLKSEALGQGEAIAVNLREMFGLKVPIVSVVIGEGGSGGALAIGCANILLMLENSVFYVASPEACAAILWKNSKAAPKAAKKLKITAPALRKLKIADMIIPEPLGGAHVDPTWTSQQIKFAVMKAMEVLSKLDNDGLLKQRHMKFRTIGRVTGVKPLDPVKKRRMKPKEANSLVSPDIEMGIENLKRAAQEASGKSPSSPVSTEAIEKLSHQVDKEMTDAFVSMGLQEKLETLKMELSNSPGGTLNPVLKERVEKLVQEFKNNFSPPGSFEGLKQKLEMLSEVNRLQEQKEKREKLKKEINEKPPEKLKAQMDVLRKVREMVAQGEKLDEDQIEKVKGELKEIRRLQEQKEKREKPKKEINEKPQEKLKAQMDVFRKVREMVAQGEKLDEDRIKEVGKVKDELKEMRKSVNLEAVGVGKKTMPTAPPVLEVKLTKAEETVRKEIEKAADKAGLRLKIEELKAAIANGSDANKIEKLKSEIKEQIAAIIDADDLRRKVEATLELEVKVTKAEETVRKEIEEAIDKAGLRLKIEELKAGIANGSDANKIEKLKSEIKEQIAAVIDEDDLRRKVEATLELEVMVTKAKETVRKEMEKAVDKAGLRLKIEELKAGIANSSDANKVEKLKSEMKEQIAAVIDEDDLRRKVEATLELEVKVTKAAEIVWKEIEKAIDKAGLRLKIEELNAAIANGSDANKIEKLRSEIKEEIAAVIDADDLRRKVEATSELEVKVTKGKETVRKEIEKAADKAGLRLKIEELNAAIANGSDANKIEKLKSEMKEQIAAVIDVGMTSRRKVEATSELEVKVTKAEETVRKEIEKAIDKAGLRLKIEELKAGIANGSDANKIEKLRSEIKEQIAAVIDADDLRRKVEATSELEVKVTKVKETVRKEIEKAVDKAGLRLKIEELKAGIANGSDANKIEKLKSEIKEQIAAVIDADDLRRKVEASSELEVEVTKGKETVRKEIEKALDKAGLRLKILELKAGIANGSDANKIEKLKSEMKEQIAAVIDVVMTSRRKVETVYAGSIPN